MVTCQGDVKAPVVACQRRTHTFSPLLSSKKVQVLQRCDELLHVLLVLLLRGEVPQLLPLPRGQRQRAEGLGDAPQSIPSLVLSPQTWCCFSMSVWVTRYMIQGVVGEFKAPMVAHAPMAAHSGRCRPPPPCCLFTDEMRLQHDCCDTCIIATLITLVRGGRMFPLP